MSHNTLLKNTQKWKDHFLGPLSSWHQSYIKDTWHFLDTMRPHHCPDQFTTLHNWHWQNIHKHKHHLRAISNTFTCYPDPNRPDSDENSQDVPHPQRLYLQQPMFFTTEGTSMGHYCPLQPSFYLNYLDDIISAWPHGKDWFCVCFVNSGLALGISELSGCLRPPGHQVAPNREQQK